MNNRIHKNKKRPSAWGNGQPKVLLSQYTQLQEKNCNLESHAADSLMHPCLQHFAQGKSGQSSSFVIGLPFFAVNSSIKGANSGGTFSEVIHALTRCCITLHPVISLNFAAALVGPPIIATEFLTF